MTRLHHTDDWVEWTNYYGNPVIGRVTAHGPHGIVQVSTLNDSYWLEESKLRPIEVSKLSPDQMEITNTVTVELIDHMGGDDSIIHAMLVSTLGHEAADVDASYGRINFLMKNRHGTPFEHNAVTFFVAAPIFVFREFHRHRIGFSYNEMSGRYKQLPAKFYVPDRDRPMIQVGKPGSYTMEPEPDIDKFIATMEDLCRVYAEAYKAYERILERGHAKEIARACLPVAIFSEMYVTCNARSLMSFLSLRIDDPTAAHPSKPLWEIQLVAKKMEESFAALFPLTYRAYMENRRVAP